MDAKAPVIWTTEQHDAFIRRVQRMSALAWFAGFVCGVLCSYLFAIARGLV